MVATGAKNGQVHAKRELHGVMRKSDVYTVFMQKVGTWYDAPVAARYAPRPE